MRAAVACCALLLVAARASAAAELVTLDRGAAYELSWSGTPPAMSARVYVTRAAAAGPDPIAVTLHAVAEGQRTDPALSGRFQLAPATLSGARSWFDVQVPAGPDVEAGTYEATVTFTQGTASQDVAVRIVVPAATLSIPASLLLERTIGLDGSHDDGSGARLHVVETSGKSHARIQFLQVEPLADGARQYGASVVLPPTTVGAGAHEAVHPTVTGNLPVGQVSGRITIRSAQLAAPIAVAVQVRTRLTRWVLGAVIFAGLVAGFGARIAWKRRIEVREARQRAFAIYDQLRDRSIDPGYAARMAAARAGLAAAIQAADATKDSIAAAIAAADAARQDAEKDLNDRRVAVAAERTALAEVVKPGWSLPAALAAVVRPAAAAVDEADRHLRSGNVTAAADALRPARSAFLGAAPAAVAGWVRDARHWIEQVRALDAVIEPGRRRALEEEAAALKVASTVGPDAGLGALGEGLRAIHAVHGAAADVSRAAADAVAETFAGMSLALSDRLLPHEDAWREARAQTARLAAAVRDLAPGATLEGDPMRARVQQIRGAWRDALLRQVAGARPEERLGIEQLFDSAAFGAAAEAAARLLPPAPGSGDAFTADHQDIGEAARPEAGAAPALAPAPPPPGALLSPAESLDALRARTVSELFRDQLLQWIVSAAALTFIGVVLQAESFVGSWQNLLTAFLWGFTTDIGVDAIVSAGKKAG